MSVTDVKRSSEQKMQKSLESLKNALSRIRTGRAHAGLLDHIHVDYYGSMVPLSQVANVGVQDARTISVQPWEKKIRESDLGLNPVTVGELIRVPMPPLSEERRRELAKVCKSEGEQAKVAVRNLRREANEQLKKLLKDKAISEDDDRKGQDEIQKLTDRYIGEVDKQIAAKEQEILTV
jgi:ribosome recycling factor